MAQHRRQVDDLHVGSDDLRVGSDDLRVGSDDLHVGSDDLHVGSDDLHVGSDDLRSDDLNRSRLNTTLDLHNTPDVESPIGSVDVAHGILTWTRQCVDVSRIVSRTSCCHCSLVRLSTGGRRTTVDDVVVVVF